MPSFSIAIDFEKMQIPRSCLARSHTQRHPHIHTCTAILLTKKSTSTSCTIYSFSLSGFPLVKKKIQDKAKLG
jgi:hypothetical protein